MAGKKKAKPIRFEKKNRCLACGWKLIDECDRTEYDPQECPVRKKVG